MKPTIQLYSGAYFDYSNPEAGPFHLIDIAHALSNICRYTGHPREFYSVAEHSIHVSFIVRPELAMVGLLHDAAEAYLGDVNAPLKQLLPEYKYLEERVERALFAEYGIPYELLAEVKEADLRMLKTEQSELMHPDPDSGYWSRLDNTEVAPVHIGRPMYPELAREAFINRFFDLNLNQPVAE